MKKIILAVFILLLAVTGCSGGEAEHENLTDSVFVIEEQAYKISELEAAISELQEAVVAYHQEQLLMENHIGELNSEIRTQEREAAHLFAHGQNEAEVRENFMQFFHAGDFAVVFEEFIGIPFHYMYMFYNETTIGENYLVAHMDWANFDFLFNYEINQITGEPIWHFIGYDVPGLPNSFGIFREPPVPRRFENLQDAIIRLYQFPTDVADGGPNVFGDFPYIEERISGENFWQEAILRLSCRINGRIHIHDFWWEGDTLYVDLKIGMLFDHGGPGFGSTVSARRLIQTFYSFPSTTTVIFMLDGRRLPFVTSEDAASSDFWWMWINEHLHH